MPLVVFCGTPLSGKSYRARQLYDHLSQLPECGKCVLVSDEEKLASQGPNNIYRSSAAEKELRAWLKSEVQRSLSSPDTVVLLDAANYIKGYRYELHCLSKQFRTTHLVVECQDAPEAVVERHLQESGTEGDETARRRKYSREIYIELMQRFEQPDANNRWDSPLFKVPYQEGGLPLEAIKDAILKRVALKANLSTQSQPTTTDNFLYELDCQTQEIIRQIQVALQSNQLRAIKIAGSEVQVNLIRKVPIAELNRLRRQFINYTRTHPFGGKDSIVSAFVQFINKSAS
ncbi:PREDICTED: protein KTI12 homolog [Rhagoletis zephyria]|uniref:protein KTI12 homolog n=1 Tax=Rhagoletis zephyria TaxID=28612 RepID=UPI000811717C|nr:PREDICTED: protein KTI12 homolog [Rhagoletis zephyria]